MIDRAPEVRRLHALVIKLVNLYYHTLWGHHKSRDCYFHIDICFTAFKPEATFTSLTWTAMGYWMPTEKWCSTYLRQSKIT